MSGHSVQVLENINSRNRTWPDRAPAGDNTAQHGHLTTLIVDDETPVAEELARYLARRGLPTRTASSAQEALDQIAARPDIGTVIADIRMPGASGLDLVSQLRQWKPNCDDPAIVMMTAHGTMDDAIVALRLGAVEFLRKPFRMAELERVVRQAQARTMTFRKSQGADGADLATVLDARIDALDNLWDADPVSGLQSPTAVLNALSLLDKTSFCQLACLVLCQLRPQEYAAENDANDPAAGAELMAELEQETARRLRTTGSIGDLICQSGNNGFMILRTNATAESCKRWVEHLKASLCAPYRSPRGDVVRPHLSFGVAHTSRSAGRPLRAAAQAALAKAADGIGDQICWDGSPTVSAARAQVLITGGQGIDSLTSNLGFRFQPIVRMDDRHLAGFEMLLRWEGDTPGTIQTGDLVAEVERSGWTRGLDEYVVRQAMTQIGAWRARFGFPGYISVNVCPASLEDAGFAACVRNMLREHGLPAGQVCMEVIESAISDLSVVDQLSALRRDGFKISIDDFGWGFSSLSRLLELPADIVKFDRQFLHQEGNPAELREFLTLAHNLVKSCRIQTLAEGVESDIDWGLVRDVGFDYAQGYWLGVPLREDDVTQLLANS